MDLRISLRRRHAARGRVAPALLLAASLVLTGCPMTPLIGSGKTKGSAGEDPGPPTVLNPSLLDRG